MDGLHNSTCISMAAKPIGLSNAMFDDIITEVMQQRSLLLTSLAVGVISSCLAVITYCGMLLIGCIRSRLYTVIEVRQRDPLYQWLLDWLAAQREIQEKGSRVFAEVHPDFHKHAKTAKHVRVRCLPIDDGSLYMFRFGGAFVWVSHHSVGNPSMTTGKGMHLSFSELRLRITVLGRSKQAANALFQAAFDYNKARLGGRTEVFVAQPHEQAEHSHWRRLEPRRNRPLNTVVAASSPGPDVLIADMKAFFNSETWYAERGLPYRRGYLFHGPPGCGKTSFVTAAAGVLDCPIYILNLAEPNLSDIGLLKLVTEAPPQSMLLMEDVDAAFHCVRGKEGTHSSSKQSQRDSAHMGLLTFSGLLNALDGVAGQEGKLVIMTTNHPEQLDHALVRPGRVDFRAQFNNASRCATQEVFCNFFAGGAFDMAEIHKASVVFASKCPEGTLPIAAIQGHLMQFRDNPLAAAASDPPNASKLEFATRVKQFVVPAGAANCGSGQEEE